MLVHTYLSIGSFDAFLLGSARSGDVITFRALVVFVESESQWTQTEMLTSQSVLITKNTKVKDQRNINALQNI